MRKAWTELPFREGLGLDHTKSAFSDVRTYSKASLSATVGYWCKNHSAVLSIVCVMIVSSLCWSRVASSMQPGDGGRIFFTPGVSAEGVAFSHQALALVQRFEDFTPDNDPHEEHDFGSLTHNGHKLFWKIDYYHAACGYGSEDPADPARTVRVLTIMLANEY